MKDSTNIRRSVNIGATILLSVVVAIAITYFLCTFIQYVDDEFVSYMVIGCLRVPYLRATIYTPGNICGDLMRELWGLGLRLPLASPAWYAGGINALPYLPFFALWPHPASSRVYGVMVIFLQAYILSRYFRLRYATIAAGLLLFFPYFFSHFVDLGPVRLQTTAMILSAICIHQWCLRPRIRYALCLGLLTFLGIWAKFTYFWVLPPLVLIFIFELMTRWGAIYPRKYAAIFHSLLAIALCGILTSWIVIFPLNADGSVFPIFRLLKTFPALSWSDYLQGDWMNSRLFSVALRSPLSAVLWIVGGSIQPDTLLLWYYPIILAAYLCTLTLFSIVAPTWRMLGLRSFIYFTAGILTLLIAARSTEARFMHHAVMAFPFFILALGALWEVLRAMIPTTVAQRMPMLLWFVFIGCFTVLNVDAYASLRMHDRSLAVNQARFNALLDDPMITSEYLVVILDYNAIFTRAVYGHPSQHLRYFRALKEEKDMRVLRELAETEKRKLLFVNYTSELSADLPLLKTIFALSSCRTLPQESRYQVLFEDNGNPQHPCHSTAT